jgi:hypothetical protein
MGRLRRTLATRPVRRSRRHSGDSSYRASDQHLETWLGAFNGFEDARKKAAVRTQRVHQPVDDHQYILVTFDFDTVAEATAFKSSLESTVCASAETSPALAGTPKARILTEVAAAT